MKKPHFKLKTTQGNIALSTADLTAHLAVAQRFWGIGGFGGYLPNPDPVLRKLGRNIAVYRELLSDPIVAGHVRRRKAAITSMDWHIEANGAPESVVQTITDLLEQLPLYAIIKQILDAALFGYQPLEVIWQQDKLWLPQSIVAKPQEWFHFNSDGVLCLHINGYGEATAVPDYKFLCPTNNASYTNPYGTGDLASVYWPTIFKRGGLKFWAEFAEKFGAPWIIGKEPRSNTPADTDRLLDALEQLIGNAVASIPNDSSVEIKEAAGKQGSADVYDRFIRYCRSEIAIALLGQDQTTEKDTNHASAAAGLEVTEDIRDDDCRIVESCFNQLIDWVCTFNFPANTPRPSFVLFTESEGDKTQAERDQILVNCGVALSENYFKRSYNLSDEDIDNTKVTTSSTLNFAEPRSDGPKPQDLADKLYQASLPNAHTLNRYTEIAMQAVAAQLSGSLDEITEDELLERLAAAYPQMNTDKLQDKLTEILFLADTLGRLEAQAEMEANA